MSSETLRLTDHGWVPAEPIKFAYPWWIEVIPFRCLRRKVKRWWYWRGADDE